MSEKSQLYRFDRDPAVLVIGQDSDILDLVVEEVRAAAIDARGLTAGEAEGALSGPFDLVTFVGAIPWPRRRLLEREALFHNPATRFVSAYPPFAAAQIVAAARNTDASTVDLGAYFDRIGYSGPAEPTLEVLRALHRLHPAAIPFEAIDVLLDRGIDIDPAAIDSKLIHRRRGGYCFEQNSLFARVLRAIGFTVDDLASHVRWMAEPGASPPPLTHRVLRVIIDGTPWLADVGFGSAVPTAPLRLDTNHPQPTEHETYRIIAMGQHRLLQAQVEGAWKPVYSIASEPWLESHYQMANWHTATHPSSHFRHRLIVTRTTPEARHILSDGRLTIRRPDGTVDQRYLQPAEIMKALEEIFLLPVEADWLPVAERAAAAVAAERLAEAA